MKDIDNPQVDNIYIQRCLELASNGLGSVAPNPMVGAVISYKGRIVGEGYHQKFGESHAEVNAIQCIRDKSILRESTLYVNLEPCAHMGKTPPCTDLILSMQIPKVIIGSSDPNEIVKGKGIKKLRQNGVDVRVGILEKECRDLNKRFFTFHEQKRPYIILKWAQTKDGFIDVIRNPEVKPGVNWISHPASRMLVHKWRSEEQGIMVGTNTVISDNPKLTVREWEGEHPLRIILDRNLRLDNDFFVFNKDVKTIIFNEIETKQENNIQWVKQTFHERNLENILQDLYEREITSIIVEGGKELLESLINLNYWDEARIFIGDKEFKNGLKAPEIEGNIISEEPFLSDLIRFYRNVKAK